MDIGIKIESDCIKIESNCIGMSEHLSIPSETGSVSRHGLRETGVAASFFFGVANIEGSLFVLKADGSGIEWRASL